MVIIGVLSILVAFGMLVYFSFKGFSIIWLAPICTFVVLLGNNMNLYEAITGPFMGGFAGVIQQLFPIFLLSIMLGRLYMDTGAAISFSKTLMNTFAKTSDQKKKQKVGVVICIITGFSLAYGGIDTFCVLFTLYPVVLSIIKEANIPRRYMVGLICCGVSAAAVTPGAPLVPNYIPMQLLGTTATASLIPGLVSSLIVAIGGGIYLTKSISKACDKGEVFEYSALTKMELSDNKEYPSFIFSIIPIFGVVISFNVIKLNLVYSLGIGMILALVLLTKYYDTTEFGSKSKALIKSLNAGGVTSSESIIMLAIMVGFASVVQASPVFQNIIDSVLNIPLPALFVVLFATMTIVGLTGSPPAGLQIVIPILSSIFVGVNPAAIHRVATVATQTFDTLPFQGAIIIMLGMCGLTHKEGYFPVFIVTVVNTFIASIVCATLLTVIPGLA